ncbi:L-carnitine dehydratase/bile acid-inducible protein F [hydrothermal vent metagenome]|uniref:L-carnitine dehydratase/bile acid-inducible protein F n=1 Tax=hydrothermal vent metagenome TaxID=652676 RepID=A0A3B0TTT9_9ZZZZ
MSGGPLAGVKVLELARILAGPWAGQVLADLGADVIKVERPGSGDDTRGWGPPFVEGSDGEALDAAYFHGCNRGKRSVEIDLASPEGQEAVRALVARSHVLIENFKTGGLAAYGLDYEAVRRINPALVYCSITGFGHTGPRADEAGYDFMIQGMSGLMDVTGEPDGEPQKVGVAVADLITGLYSVIGIQAALSHARATGEGQHIDMSLFDCQTAGLVNQAMNYLVSGTSPRRLGNAHPNIAPYETVSVADGHVIVAVGNDRQFKKLMEILGEPQLAGDRRYLTNAARVKNRAALHKTLAQLCGTWTRDNLLAALKLQNVPAGPINTVADALNDPQTVARGLKLDRDHRGAKGGTVPSVRTPIIMSATPLVYGRAAPRLGEHTDEVLSGLKPPKRETP